MWQVPKPGSPHAALAGLDLGKEHAELEYEPGSVASVRSWDYARSPLAGGGLSYPADSLWPEPSFESFLDDLYERQNQLGSALMV